MTQRDSHSKRGAAIRRVAGISAVFGLAFVAIFLGFGITRSAAGQIDGRQIFRFDTFGDEQLWTNVLQMHEVVATVDPATALSVGLKVDVDALPTSVIAALRAGHVDLTNPAVTTELIRLNAVVGVKGAVDDTGRLASLGVTCALCHSTVDNSFAPGIGSVWTAGPTAT